MIIKNSIRYRCKVNTTKGAVGCTFSNSVDAENWIKEMLLIHPWTSYWIQEEKKIYMSFCERTPDGKLKFLPDFHP